MVHVISLLATALSPYLGELQPIIFLDVCRLHLASWVIAACHAAHIWPIAVPAQMTWLLQPLDTHAFGTYKLRLKEAYQAARAATEDGAAHLLVAAFAGRVERLGPTSGFGRGDFVV